VGRKSYGYRENDGPHSPWGAVAELASRQHGVVSVAQLQSVEVDRQRITRWLADGRLHRLHRGVYAVGHLALTTRSRELAAVLACGPHALLSHRSAGAAHGFIRHRNRIEITAPRSRAGAASFLLHRSRRIDPQDRTRIGAIPTTSVARTLVDLCDVLTEQQLARAINEAEVHRVFDLEAIEEVLERLPGRTGRHGLHRVLARYAPAPTPLRSEAERRFRRLCADHGLPPPQNGIATGGYELDFFWSHARLAIEVDGAAFHHTVKAFHADRRRDRELAVQGIQVIRGHLGGPRASAGQGGHGAECDSRQ